MARFLPRIPRESKVAAVVLAMALLQVGVLAGLGLDRSERSLADVQQVYVERTERALRAVAAAADERISVHEGELADAVSRGDGNVIARIDEALRRAPLFGRAYLVDGTGALRDAFRPPYEPAPAGAEDPMARARLDEILAVETVDKARCAAMARALADEIERRGPGGDTVAAALALQTGARASLVGGDAEQALQLARRILGHDPSWRALRDDRGALAEREPLGVSASAIACEALFNAVPAGTDATRAAFADHVIDRRIQVQRLGELLSPAARRIEIDECNRLRTKVFGLGAQQQNRIDAKLKECDALDEAFARVAGMRRGPLAAATESDRPTRLAHDGALVVVVAAPGAAPSAGVAFVAEPATLRDRVLRPALGRTELPLGVGVVVRDAAGAVVSGGDNVRPDLAPLASAPLGDALPGLRAEAFLFDASSLSRESDTARRYWLWVLMAVALAVLAASLLAVRAVLREVRLARMKSDFASNLSHELRTPLTSLRMFVETLQEGRVKDEKEAKECLDVIAQETDRLSSFVDRILTFAAFEKGRAPIDLRDADAGEVAGNAAELFRKRAESAGARIELDVAEGLPPVRLDRGAIIQVLLNLLDNAVKHGGQNGAHGATRIRVSVREHAGGTEIMVEDDGPGVPERERDLVFEDFYRGDDTLSRRTQGAGIGLALCKRIALAHGGRIDAGKSKALGGAAFRLRFPATPRGAS